MFQDYSFRKVAKAPTTIPINDLAISGIIGTIKV
jgi:hypothetical protein